MDMEHQNSTEESIHGRLNCKEAFTSPVNHRDKRCSMLSHNLRRKRNLILQQRRGLLYFRLLVDWRREEDQCPPVLSIGGEFWFL
ncbi:unnamed protein product [Arabidopsis halleri]